MSSEAVYFANALASVADEPESVAIKRQSIRSDSLVEEAAPRTTHVSSGTSAGIAEESDEEVLENICCGVREALAALFRRYARLVRSIGHRILRDEAEADELVQEVFLFVFRKAELFDPSLGTARSWIVQITYHRAIDRHRQLVSRHFYDAVNLEAPAAAALHTEMAFYERSLEGRLGKETLARMRESLSEDQRRTLELYFFEGYTIEEIAEQMGQSSGNVRHHYYRALEKMRKLAFAEKLRLK